MEIVVLFLYNNKGEKIKGCLKYVANCDLVEICFLENNLCNLFLIRTCHIVFKKSRNNKLNFDCKNL